MQNCDDDKVIVSTNFLMSIKQKKNIFPITTTTNPNLNIYILQRKL